ncbi:MAG: hypothetical protein ABJ327_00450 [Litoreibacter sp.]
MGISFIPAEDSVNGLAQISVSFEGSGTTAIYNLELGKEIDDTYRSETIDGTIASLIETCKLNNVEP